MANKYLDILNITANGKNQMGLSNTIKRDYGIPLDFTSVQESYDAAVAYAATSTLAYVGQTVAVGGKLYIISDVANGTHTVGEGETAHTYDNYLAEVGSKTEGDGNTIELDGQTLKLAGLTGLDTNKTYVPSLVGGKLVWAEPDTSTAEGQQQAIEGLNTRMETAEGDIDALETAVADNKAAAETAIAGEKTAREEADAALETKIAEALAEAKKYADDNDADTAYDDTQVKADVQANADAIGEIQTALANVYTKEEIDDKVDAIDEAIEGINTTIAGITHFTTQIVESVDYISEVGVLYLIKDDTVEGVDKYNEYLYIEGTGPVLIGDTTTDLSDYVTNDALAAAIADFVTNGSLATTLADYAKTADVELALADKANAADVVANDTFETFKTENAQAIADARTNAVADVEAKGYAVDADVQAKLDTKIETATVAHTTEETAEGATVTGTNLNIVVDAFTKAETRQYVADTISQMTGGESAADVLLALNNYKSDNDERVGAIETKNNEQDTAIAAAQAQADKGVDDAKAAADAVAALASGQVATNKGDLDVVKNRLTTLETAKGDHEARITSAEGAIAALQEADAGFTSEIAALNTTVGGHTETIGQHTTKLTELAAADTALDTAIKANTAKFADYSTTDEMNVAIDNKIAAIPAVDLSAYAKTEDVNAELALKANAADVYTKGEADAQFMTEGQVDDRLNALINASDPEGGKVITDVQNLVKYVDENAGEIAALITATNANTNKLAGIDTTVTDYLANALAAIVQPKASAEVTVAEDGTLGIGEINVNKLVQTEGDELIIDGGRA